MPVIIWIAFGLLVGFVANHIMGRSRRGLLRTMIIGLLGAVLGGWIASLLGVGSVTAFTVEGFVIATGGAVLLIWLLRRL